MAKQYRVITDNQNIADDQKTVEVTEEVSETKRVRTTPAQKRQEYDKLERYIQQTAIEADAVVDELKAMKSNVGLTFTVPARMQDTDKGTIQVPMRVEKQSPEPA